MYEAKFSFFFSVVRNATFNLGSDANLTCSDKTWNETMYVIWKISLKNSKECRMSFSNDGQSEDLCNDSKSLRNSSKSRPYLHIPNFSNNDVGIYRCESAFKGGIENYEINVAITGRTSLLPRTDDLGRFTQITRSQI